MPSTPTLRAFPPPLRYDVHPLARLNEGGAVEACVSWLPAAGPCLLLLWRPDGAPAFEAVRGVLRRAGQGWRFEPAAGPAWVVLHVADPGAAGKGS